MSQFFYREWSRTTCGPLTIPLAFLTAFFVLSMCPLANAQATSDAHKQVTRLIDENATNFKEVSQQIWTYAELGYHEEKSSSLLQAQLKDAGFSIESGVADEPTAFIASYGQGKPVIGILGEFDALPGLSQKALPHREPLVSNAPGHGCGHNLLGSGAALAAVAVKEFMAANHISGTLRYYGTPAEEGGSGKVFMVRAGLFKDVDVVLHWHPGDHNSVNNGGMLAVISARVTFHGIAAQESILGHDVFLFSGQDFLTGPQLQTVVDRSEALRGAFSHREIVWFCGEIFRGSGTDGYFQAGSIFLEIL